MEGSDGSEGHAGPAAPPPCYVVLHSVAKRHNGAAVIRSAVAFGVKAVIMVGSDKVSGSYGVGGGGWCVCLLG